EGPRAGAGYRRPVTKLSRAPDVRHADRRAPRRMGGADETGRRQTRRRGPGQHRRLRVVAAAAARIRQRREELGSWNLELLIAVRLKPDSLVSLFGARTAQDALDGA